VVIISFAFSDKRLFKIKNRDSL